MKPQRILAFLLLFNFLFNTTQLYSQACTANGQTPTTAFPVCGTTTFTQNVVPVCSTNDLFVPGCSGPSVGANYQNKNPFFYKFTCYVSGTLGFVITPLASNEDYDWQLYDITGRNPNDIFTVNSLVVTGNWSGSYGPTGASSSGVNFIQCASDPADNKPRFAAMPVLTAGREYLLMVSHYTDTQSGYTLAFGGGTAVITDPKVPTMFSAKADCDGKVITLKLNKQIRCSSITSSGSEFSLSPAASTVVSAVATNCTTGFDFNEVTITLAAALPNGTFDLIINNGRDGNTLLDICGTGIAVGNKVSFTYAVPQPIFADSIGKIPCTPDSIRIYFPKKISCASIAADGSDFVINGPSPVSVISAGGNCASGKTDYIVVKFAVPIFTKGIYQLTLKAGNDGTVLIDECGQETPTQILSFTTADTVNAEYTYTQKIGCQRDTLTFSHNGAHDVNNWNWTFNNGSPVITQSHTIIFPATSTNNIQLIVSNGTCSDTATSVIDFDNEVKTDFAMPSFICPEDKLEVLNNSQGQIDSWKWTFDVITTSNLKDPAPVQFPIINREAYYTIKLVATNNSLNCSDSTKRTLTVLDHCLIAVPTAFTPNGDGRNDFFRPHNALKADKYEFKVYNRWGQLVFQTNNWQDKWDGKISGELQASGVFVWMLKYTHMDTKKEMFEKGTVTLIR